MLPLCASRMCVRRLQDLQISPGHDFAQSNLPPKECPAGGTSCISIALQTEQQETTHGLIMVLLQLNF